MIDHWMKTVICIRSIPKTAIYYKWSRQKNVILLEIVKYDSAAMKNRETE
jgi:hypothetical protein